MLEEYHKLWILLRERLTRYENNEERILDKEVFHLVLSEMSNLEAAHFLED